MYSNVKPLSGNSEDPDQLAFYKQADLDLHCISKKAISGFSLVRIKQSLYIIKLPTYLLRPGVVWDIILFGVEFTQQ